MAKKKKRVMALFLAMTIVSGLLLSGCGSKDDADGKVVIELVHYKPEAVDVFEALEEKFNATHDNIKLVIDSPGLSGKTILILLESAAISTIPISWMLKC